MIDKLPPRERELVQALYARGEASAAELERLLPGAPSNSTVRVMLARLEKKGFVTRRRVDQKYVYSPALPERKVKQSAVRQLVDTFFGGSPVSAASAMLGMSERVDEAELDELERMIAKVREEKAK